MNIDYNNDHTTYHVPKTIRQKMQFHKDIFHHGLNQNTQSLFCQKDNEKLNNQNRHNCISVRQNI